MATNIVWRRRLLANGTAFTDAGSNDVKLYLSNSAGAVGAEVGGMTYVSGGWWTINIDIDTYNSGYYILKYTTNGAVWTTINGDNDSGAPLWINLENTMPLRGGTMSGNIVMGDHSVTGVDTISFTDTAGTVGGIQNQNLIDKTADETVTGAWTWSGNNTITGANSVTGITNFTTDKLKINSIIAQPYHYITHTVHEITDQTDIDTTIFVSDGKYTVVSIEEVHEVAAGDACKLQVERLSGTEASGAGDDILTNNGAAGFDLAAAAKTIQTGTLTNNTLTDGDRLGLVSTGTETSLQGLHVTIALQYTGA